MFIVYTELVRGFKMQPRWTYLHRKYWTNYIKCDIVYMYVIVNMGEVYAIHVMLY